MTGTLHSRERDRQAVSFHYDQSNDFFQTFLGPRMVYTCAIFGDPNEPLVAAEDRQFDLICRKLRLKPGERLLDIGCGWGGLAMHAAKHYGAHVVGVTLSERQAEFARARIRAAGLDDRCRIDLVDYRDINEAEAFDKITTVEVMEHFGARQFPVYFQKCWRLLRPQGSLLIQQITLGDPALLRPSIRAQIQAFIFPDGELVPISYTMGEAEKAGFEVRDLESFREHYVLTLRHWLNNLEANHAEAVRALDESAYRNFRLYLAGACRLFQQSQHGVHQLLLAKSYPSASGYPLSRHDWYRD
jgi:cyclopropane-fatty-acyl-phospholipid synthase